MSNNFQNSEKLCTQWQLQVSLVATTAQSDYPPIIEFCQTDFFEFEQPEFLVLDGALPFIIDFIPSDSSNWYSSDDNAGEIIAKSMNWEGD